MIKKRTTKSRNVKKSVSKKRKTKKPFGGYAISFKDRDESLEQVFGKTEITPSEMTKKIWKFIKSKKLSNK